MKTAIYREDSAKVRVEVISDETTGDKRTAVLRCIESIRPHPMCGHWPTGVETTVEATKAYQAMCWDLEYES
jgi:hypothetical protein